MNHPRIVKMNEENGSAKEGLEVLFRNVYCHTCLYILDFTLKKG